MIELDIESKIVSAIEDIVPNGVSVRGVWDTAGDGDLKDEEELGEDAVVAVAVGQRQFDTFGLCKAEMQVSIAFAAMIDRDPRGELTLDVSDKLLNLLTEWHFDADGRAREALSVDGFAVAGMRLAGGQYPQKQGDTARSVSFDFTIVGTVAHNH